MKMYERDEATRKADIYRAMRYSYRVNRRTYQKKQALVCRLILASAFIFVAATAAAVLV